MQNTNKMSKLTKVLIIAMCFIMAFLAIVTYAWFTTKSPEFTSELNFGTIKINTSVNDETEGGEVVFANSSTNNFALPGDYISLIVNVKNAGLSDCYYMVSIITDNEILKTNFNGDFYFNPTLTDDENTPYDERVVQVDLGNVQLGSLRAEVDASEGVDAVEAEEHTVKVTVQIPTTLTQEDQVTLDGVRCVVFAVQQANITPQQGYEKLLELKNETLSIS